MTILRAVNCLALSLAPYGIYYFATELSEYEAWRSAGYGSIASVITALVRGFFTALYTPAGSSNVPLRAAVAALISLTDVVGLWYALSKFSHRNISNSHKFQAVGLGWAFSSVFLFHLAPILAGAFSTEFNPSVIYKAVHANVALAHMLSMACAGVMLWSKKAKPAGLLPTLRVLVVTHAMIPAVLGVMEDLHAVSSEQGLMLHTVATGALMAAAYAAWQQCNPKAPYAA